MTFGSLGSLGRGFGRMGSGGKGGSVIIPGTLAAGAGNYVWTGQDASLVIPSRTVAGAGGSYTWTGQDASLVKSSITLVAGGGSYAWSGDDMTPLKNYVVIADAGSYAWTGQSASLVHGNRSIAATAGSYTWTGQDATLTKSGGYTGPGDVVSGAYAWYGLRAYNAAYATGSNPAVDLRDQNGNNLVTINILSTGALDQASINSWITANSVTIPRVMRWYDQTGNGRHVTRAFASAPHLIVGAVGSYPSSILFGSSRQLDSASSAFTVAQPLTVVAGAMFTANGSIGNIFGNSNNFEFAVNTTPALRLKNNTATAHATTLSTSTWYAFQGMYNGASSVATVNTTNTTVSPGTTGISSSTMAVGNDGFGQVFTGSLVELGIWPSDITGTSPISNMRTYGGF